MTKLSQSRNLISNAIEWQFLKKDIISGQNNEGIIKLNENNSNSKPSRTEYKKFKSHIREKWKSNLNEVWRSGVYSTFITGIKRNKNLNLNSKPVELNSHLN